MRRWPRCRRARAGSSISWSIQTTDNAESNEGLIKPRISTRSEQDDRDCSAYATWPYLLYVPLLVIGITFAAMPVHAQLAPSPPIKVVVGVRAGVAGDLTDLHVA